MLATINNTISKGECEVVFLFLRGGVTLNLMTLAVQVPFFLPKKINPPIYILTSIIL